MNLTTITGGEETLGVQAPDGKSGEGGKVTTLELAVGGAPSQERIQAGRSLLSMGEDGLLPLDPGKSSFSDSPPYHHKHPFHSGIVQEVV